MCQRDGHTGHMAEFGNHTADVLAHLADGDVPIDARFIIDQQVTADDAVVEEFRVRIADGSAAVTDIDGEPADITIRQDIDTARALRSGEIHAQRAFLTGRLSIDGNIDKLLEHGPLLTSLLQGPRA